MKENIILRAGHQRPNRWLRIKELISTITLVVSMIFANIMKFGIELKKFGSSRLLKRLKQPYPRYFKTMKDSEITAIAVLFYSQPTPEMISISKEEYNVLFDDKMGL